MNGKPLESQTTRRIPLITCATALVVALAAALPQAARADHLEPPPVPANIHVPAGNKAFLASHAVGTQNYICLPSVSGFGWTFFWPQATLFNDDGRQVITHFLSPNPVESGTPRAPRGSTPGTRAPSGPLRLPHPPTRTSSRRVRFPGSCFKWLEPDTDQTGATS